MSLEKKLGITFVGMLFFTFCGVLAMRLTDAGPDEKIDINVGRPVAELPPAPSAASSATPAAKPTIAGDRRPTAPQSFANDQRRFAADQSPGYMPPSSANNGVNPRSGLASAPPAATNPYNNSSTTAAAPARSSPYGSSTSSATTAPSTGMPTGDRYAADNRYAPPAVVAATSAPAASPAATTIPTIPSTMPPASAPPAVAASGNPLRSEGPTTSSFSSTAPVSSAAPAGFAAPNLPPPTSSQATASATIVTPPPADSSREPRTLSTLETPPQPLAAAPFASPPATASSYAQSPGVAALAAPAAPAAALRSPTADGSGVAVVSAVAPAASGRDEPYVVAPGDNLFTISQKVYGDGAYYRALFAYNSDRYPHAEDIRSGNVLDVPPLEFLKKRYPDLTAAVAGGAATTAPAAGYARPTGSVGGTYTVREGDTLFDIARKQLGQASRWTELYQLNRAALGENLEQLRPGLQLKLP